MARTNTNPHGIASLIVQINEEYLNKYGTKLIQIDTGEVGGVSKEFRWGGIQVNTNDLAGATNPVGIVSDGETLIFSDDSDDSLFQCSFGERWNAATLSYDGIEVDVSPEDTGPDSMTTDGETLILSGTSNNELFQYSFGTEWDLSTLSYGGARSALSGLSEADGVASNGDKLVASDSSSDIIKEYEMDTWDLSTLSPTGVEIDSGIGGNNVNSGALVADDNTLVVGDINDGEMIQREWNSWDLSTAYFRGALLRDRNVDSNYGLDGIDGLTAGGGTLLAVNDSDDLINQYGYYQPFQIPNPD